MSTNQECSYIEIEPGQWMIVLEDSGAPKNAWDWRENASSYGMFATEEQADAWLHTHFANPGGYSPTRYEAAREPDEIEQALIKVARHNKDQVGKHSMGGGVWIG